MEYDENKVDDIMLALLWLNMFDQAPGTRVWKRHNFKRMDRPHEKGFIDNPKENAESVMVTEEGRTRARGAFRRHFALECNTD